MTRTIVNCPINILINKSCFIDTYVWYFIDATYLIFNLYKIWILYWKSSVVLLERLSVEEVSEVVRHGRLRWYGHLQRKDASDWVSKCRDLEWMARDEGVELERPGCSV